MVIGIRVGREEGEEDRFKMDRLYVKNIGKGNSKDGIGVLRFE